MVGRRGKGCPDPCHGAVSLREGAALLGTTERAGWRAGEQPQGWHQHPPGLLRQGGSTRVGCGGEG